ncbi:DUF1573 domain-containing protein [Candidatus Uhrbacteria bacterium]|nr:DUF1573 domain-containing protein [Candidatus Uhrbacteria bacterium]
MQRILIILTALSIGVAVVWLGYKTLPEDNVEVINGHIGVSALLVDFGDIDQDGGIVSTTVEVSNTGEGVLEIHRLSTSCGCTTAQMNESPLSAGEARTLTIEFDPMAHPDQSGPITRVIYIQSSDPGQPELEIDITGNVIPKIL